MQPLPGRARARFGPPPPPPPPGPPYTVPSLQNMVRRQFLNQLQLIQVQINQIDQHLAQELHADHPNQNLVTQLTQARIRLAAEAEKITQTLFQFNSIGGQGYASRRRRKRKHY